MSLETKKIQPIFQSTMEMQPINLTREKFTSYMWKPFLGVCIRPGESQLRSCYMIASNNLLGPMPCLFHLNFKDDLVEH